MNPEQLFKSKFFWVLMGWAVVVIIAVSIIDSLNSDIRQYLWLGSAAVLIVWLFIKKRKSIDGYTLIGAIWFGPILLLTYLTIYYDWIGKINILTKGSVKKIDTWIRE